MTWEDGALLGGYTMPSTGESPREENASRLSQILEASPHPKYYLSEKACTGILNRAERRGKKLPPELKAALLAQSRSWKELENLGGKGILIQNERTGTLSTLNNQSVLCIEPRTPDGAPRIHEGGVVPTLNTAQGGQRQPCVSHSLKTKANCCFREDSETYPVQNGFVRRMTPMECERLQGFPDGWTDIGPWVDSKGKKHKESSDSARYKALGNSIALPFWFYLLRRISAQYERPATLGSLFDGIGGFPLCWEKCNGKGTALWASEIDEFPMAVTKARLNDQ